MVVQLKPGSDAQAAIAALTEASRTAQNILGSASSAIGMLNTYRPWSSRQIRALSEHLTVAAVDEIVTTRRYWTLQSIDPAAYGLPALAELLELEVSSCIDAMDAAVSTLKGHLSAWSRWRGNNVPGVPFHAVVLDTNVLLRHHEALVDIAWNVGLSIFPHESIGLGVPMVVVEELDRLKDSNASMFIHGEKHATRTLARQALKSLDKVFRGGYLNWQLRDRGDSAKLHGELHAILMVDDLHHARLPEADLEIIDQALRLRPFVQNVALATYDRSMIFRAQNSGLKAFRPTEDDG